MLDFIYVANSNRRYDRIWLHQLIYVEAQQTGVMLVEEARIHQLAINLGSLEVQLPADLFRRISRQHIVNLRRVEGWQSDRLFLEGSYELPIGPQYRSALLNCLPILRVKPLKTSRL